jgi:hypothetical protein
MDLALEVSYRTGFLVSQTLLGPNFLLFIYNKPNFLLFIYNYNGLCIAMDQGFSNVVIESNSTRAVQKGYEDCMLALAHYKTTILLNIF